MRERSERASTHRKEMLGHLWAILLHSRSSRSHARTGFDFCVLVFWGFSKWCSRRGETLTLRKSGALVEARRSFSYFEELWVLKVVLSSRPNAHFEILGSFGVQKWCSRRGETLTFTFWAPPWGILGHLGAILGYLGASWAILGASWAILVASWAILGRTCGQFGAILGSLWEGLPSKSVVLVEVKCSFSHLCLWRALACGARAERARKHA